MLCDLHLPCAAARLAQVLLSEVHWEGHVIMQEATPGQAIACS